MTKDEAIQVLCKGAKFTMERLADEIDNGPEGVEIYIQPRIDEFNQALDIVEGRYDERESNP